ncbi:MAG: hypothetical protein AB9834_02715 [Lentimicrobium sp.]
MGGQYHRNKQIAVVAANVTFLWGIIEFILYLVKDKAFNWLSVWGFIISIIIALVCVVFALIVKSKARTTSINSGRFKSRFQQRLEEMEQKRKSAGSL